MKYQSLYTEMIHIDLVFKCMSIHKKYLKIKLLFPFYFNSKFKDHEES